LFLNIGNLFLEIGKNGPYLALGMGPNIGPMRLSEKALTLMPHVMKGFLLGKGLKAKISCQLSL
jgi:hypothetical protein